MVKLGLGLIIGLLVGFWVGTKQLHLVPNPFLDDAATYCAKGAPQHCIAWGNI